MNGRRMDHLALEEDPDTPTVLAGAHWKRIMSARAVAEIRIDHFHRASSPATRSRLDPENAEALAIYGHVCSSLTRTSTSALIISSALCVVNPETWHSLVPQRINVLLHR